MASPGLNTMPLPSQRNACPDPPGCGERDGASSAKLRARSMDLASTSVEPYGRCHFPPRGWMPTVVQPRCYSALMTRQILPCSSRTRCLAFVRFTLEYLPILGVLYGSAVYL